MSPRRGAREVFEKNFARFGSPEKRGLLYFPGVCRWAVPTLFHAPGGGRRRWAVPTTKWGDDGPWTVGRATFRGMRRIGRLCP
jgi:hypothetical protein